MKFLVHIFFIVVVLCTQNVALAFDTKVVWAGVGFSGDWGDRHRFYPTSSALFEAEGNPLQVWARERVVSDQIYSFEIIYGQIAEGSLDKIALAITITGETVAFENIIIDGRVEYLGNYSLSGSAIFFDLESNKLIASAPLIARYTKAYKSLPDIEERQKIFYSILSNDNLELNFFNEMASELKKVNLTTLPSQFIQINSFEVNDDVHPAIASSKDIESFKYFLSTFFENRLSSASGIAVIPNKVGHVIGNKVATRLSSGDRTLILPDPGFAIDLRIHRLVYQNQPENKSTDSLCWGGVLSMSVEDRRFRGAEEEIAKIGFRDVNCCYVDKGVTLDDYNEFQKLMMGLLEGVSRQFERADQDWLKEKALDEKQARNSMKELSEQFKEAMF